jgi:hypothetical protein
MYHGPVRNDRTIFISIASYRDDECLQTVRDLYSKANVPKNVFVGIVQQNKESSESCRDMEWGSNLRVMDLSHTEARGPCYARYLASSLWRGENFFFQIDSHTRFEKDWDSELLQMWSGIRDPKAVLCHYPKDYQDKDSTNVPMNCTGEYQENGIIRMGAQLMAPPPYPVKTYWGGANFLWGHGQMILDVPFDPNLDMLFHGEELLYSARLFTHGYTIYAPNKNTIFHWYGRDEKPKFWDDVPDKKGYEEEQRVAEQRVKDILGMRGAKKDLSAQGGLGKVRSMQEFWQLTGVDFEKLQKEKSINVCDSLGKSYSKK